jgi:predicted RNA polymerase sigma factor
MRDDADGQVRCPVLVGRASEVERLGALMAALTRGIGAAVFVGGEAGIAARAGWPRTTPSPRRPTGYRCWSRSSSVTAAAWSPTP